MFVYILDTDPSQRLSAHAAEAAIDRMSGRDGIGAYIVRRAIPYGWRRYERASAYVAANRGAPCGAKGFRVRREVAEAGAPRSVTPYPEALTPGANAMDHATLSALPTPTLEALACDLSATAADRASAARLLARRAERAYIAQRRAGLATPRVFRGPK